MKPNQITSKPAGGMRPAQYELTFIGSASVRTYRIPRHRRKHASLAEAKAAAREVHAKMRDQGTPTACHQAIIYGPGCGDGIPA
jgi:hypothetical protein